MVGVTPEDVSEALNARWADLEDCLVARCAEEIGADYIVTRNVKDFSKSSVEAVTPKELFACLEKQGETFEEIEW